MRSNSGARCARSAGSPPFFPAPVCIGGLLHESGVAFLILWMCSNRTKPISLPSPFRGYVDPTAIVTMGAVLEGNVHVGAECVCHPRGCIRALAGPVYVGESTIVEEFVDITNRSMFDELLLVFIVSATFTSIDVTVLGSRVENHHRNHHLKSLAKGGACWADRREEAQPQLCKSAAVRVLHAFSLDDGFFLDLPLSFLGGSRESTLALVEGRVLASVTVEKG